MIDDKARFGLHDIARCAGCAHRLYFHEREAHPQTFCFACAKVRGLTRICDRSTIIRFR